MNFFEGRIYKPQGKNLAASVSSRVPVVLGSLSVQDGVLYYCKSCTYDSTNKTYKLEWAEVKGKGKTDVTYNRAVGGNHVRILSGITDYVSTSSDSERVWTQKISFSPASSLVPAYPSMHILTNTINSNIKMIDALFYAAMSDFNIDGYVVTSHFYGNSRVWYSDRSIGYMYKSMVHQVQPHSYVDIHKNRFTMSPSWGVVENSLFFGKDSTGDVYLDALAFTSVKNNINTLLGAHMVVTYRTFFFAGRITTITTDDDNYSYTIDDVHTNSGNNNEKITFKGFELAGPISLYDAEDYKPYHKDGVNDFNGAGDYVDESTIPQFEEFWLQFVRIHFDIDTARDITKEKAMVYIKLDPSFVAK